MDASAWASWVQAVGSIAALMVSFSLFRRQREHEQQQARDDELARRTRAVAALQDVCYWALIAMDECVEHKRGKLLTRPEADLPPRLDELREVVNRFVDPAADRVIVVTAMAFGNALLQTKNGLPYPFMDRDDAGIATMEDRNDEMRRMHGTLINIQHALEQKCAARGIAIDPALDWVE